jgi:hypothetical protein
MMLRDVDLSVSRTHVDTVNDWSVLSTCPSVLRVAGAVEVQAGAGLPGAGGRYRRAAEEV